MLNSETVYEAENAAKDLLNFVNSFTYDQEAFAMEIARGHKTLQQSVMRLFVRTIEVMSTVVPDDRNRATVELAKEITKIAHGYSLPLI